jgi:Histidine kinase-, DNA gyrase B-, and HSP90-like ATPase
MTNQQIVVQSHVARDFLQNAAYFSTVPKVIWEYVSNSLDNADEGKAVGVVVELSGQLLRVTDNASGMTRKELQNFFLMHGENIQRARGKRVRGRFGTGKCAAFGIANVLRIDTVKNAKHNVVQLSRVDIEAARSGEAFPVRDIVVNESTVAESGTIIEIADFNIRKIDVEGTISYVERHLARYRQRARVWINNHECEFKEPISADKLEFRSPPEVASKIGHVKLVVKVSPTSLDRETNGIDVLSHGIWHETTLAGLEGKDQANYIFGEVDVPILEDGEWKISPFDNTRNNTLNIQNPAVAVLMGWLSECIDDVRRKLVETEKARRQSEQARRLQQEADKIAALLNEDFIKLQVDFERARRVASRAGSVSADELASDAGGLSPGNGEEPTEWQRSGQPHGEGKRDQIPVVGAEPPREGPSLTPGNERGGKKRTESGHGRKPRGGLFVVQYYNGTPESPRSSYNPDERAIAINLDHPQISSALGASSGNTESRQFREITYEIACVEYALAIAHEQAEFATKHNLRRDAEDALYEVRDTINRVSKLLASALG